MKKISLFLVIFCLVFITVTRADITVTLFGTSQFTPTYSDFADTQTATTFQIVGTDLGSQLDGDLPSAVDITGNTFQLKLTATFVGTATQNFKIDLFDINGNDRLYKGFFADFTQNVPTTITLSFLSQTGAFDNNVTSIELLTAGGGSTVNLTMDTLLAVPEPSTYALLGLGLAFLLSQRFYRKLPFFAGA